MGDEEPVRWDGERYQQRFDALAASGADVHGEADFIEQLHPSTVLDAGCGTGRVARVLATRGIEVAGVDRDESMIATARQRSPELEWVVGDLADHHVDLGRQFDVVVMAGNVPLFTPAGTQASLVAGCAHHLLPNGVLVAGFQLERNYSLDDYDRHCRRVGLEVIGRWATWSRVPFDGSANYAVSVHQAPS